MQCCLEGYRLLIYVVYDIWLIWQLYFSIGWMPFLAPAFVKDDPALHLGVSTPGLYVHHVEGVDQYPASGSRSQFKSQL